MIVERGREPMATRVYVRYERVGLGAQLARAGWWTLCRAGRLAAWCAGNAICIALGIVLGTVLFVLVSLGGL